MLDAVTTAVVFASARILILQLKSIILSLTHKFVYEFQLFTERVKVLCHLLHMFNTIRYLANQYTKKSPCSGKMKF
jgi:hypothetical protein